MAYAIGVLIFPPGNSDGANIFAACTSDMQALFFMHHSGDLDLFF